MFLPLVPYHLDRLTKGERLLVKVVQHKPLALRLLQMLQRRGHIMGRLVNRNSVLHQMLLYKTQADLILYKVCLLFPASVVRVLHLRQVVVTYRRFVQALNPLVLLTHREYPQT